MSAQNEGRTFGGVVVHPPSGVQRAIGIEWLRRGRWIEWIVIGVYRTGPSCIATAPDPYGRSNVHSDSRHHRCPRFAAPRYPSAIYSSVVPAKVAGRLVPERAAQYVMASRLANGDPPRQWCGNS